MLRRDEDAHSSARTPIDPSTVDDPFACEVLERMASARTAVEIALVDGPYGLPVCSAYLWSEDLPILFGGAGCHTDPGIALTRALAEAAQSRLSMIAGTRDDLPTDIGDPRAAPPARPTLHASGAPWPDATARFSAARDCATSSFSEQVKNVAQAITRVTGYEPLAMHLSRHLTDWPAEAVGVVHAVQVICPGTRSRTRKAMHR